MFATPANMDGVATSLPYPDGHDHELGWEDPQDTAEDQFMDGGVTPSRAAGRSSGVTDPRRAECCAQSLRGAQDKAKPQILAVAFASWVSHL